MLYYVDVARTGTGTGTGQYCGTTNMPAMPSQFCFLPEHCKLPLLLCSHRVRRAARAGQGRGRDGLDVSELEKFDAFLPSYPPAHHPLPQSPD